MTPYSEAAQGLSLGGNRITLRGPADLADALPYLLGYHPDDSIIVIGLHGPRGRLGGRIRTGIPEAADTWPEVADQLASCLVENGGSHGSCPDAAVVYLCQDPTNGGRARDIMERLRPLAQRLRTACGALDVPVYEALYVSQGRYWSYTSPGSLCPVEGAELPSRGTSAMAAAAVYAGIRVQGSLKDLERRFAPLPEPTATRQVTALDTAAVPLVTRLLGVDTERAAVREPSRSDMPSSRRRSRWGL
jgi:hypothetical protein